MRLLQYLAKPVAATGRRAETRALAVPTDIAENHTAPVAAR